jgi:hypothetical protein
VRIDLPHGASDVTLRTLQSAPTGTRLTEGVFLVEARTRRLVAFQVHTDGLSPVATTVRVGGQTLVSSPYEGPALPIARRAGTPVPGLRPGSYVLAGFGTGTSPRAQWGAELSLGGRHRCVVLGQGTVFSTDASRSAGGTAVTTPAVSVVDGGVLQWRTDRQLVVGVMQATQELAGSASLDYRTPTATGTVTDGLVPFVSTAGRYHWVVRTTAPLAGIAVAGAAFRP